ncbi:Retrovirus-related Pol polyprotein from transposon TNT 1-94 [Cucumis melo var. makuwa]|uniref:Retrovirus-related Pol polyprotein from transposon TNT 1-94 n=1 Tax=Cucumis melo var. makuwa TaxID=1194695 RepID=A0A5A7U9T3_CUCMM|nr:Retrovirus-related Pol polyprotein from transposon TNT 1-94 [Cucumis melo var. makuwa]
MSNLASKLKALDIEINENLLMHLKDKWSINELISQCVHEEDRIKRDRTENAHLATNFHVNLASVPTDAWWVDSGATTHISISMQGCLWSQLPNDAEKFIYVDDGKAVEVEAINSRYGYLYLIHEKSQSLDIFKSFKAEVELQLGKKIKVVKSDRGGEYYGRCNRSGQQRSGPFAKYLEECGIVPQYIMPRKPSMNGVVERRNRTLKDMERSLVLGIFTSGVVQLRLCLTGLTKENWTQELLAAILLGEDKIKKVVLEEKLISLPNGAIDDVQTPIHDFTMEPTIEQDNNEVLEVQTQQSQEMPLRRFTRENRSAISDDYIMFLQEYQDDIGIMEDDPINF